MKIQVEQFGEGMILADMALAILIQNGFTKKKANEILKPHKERIKGYGNTRFVPLEVVEEILSPKEDEIEDEGKEGETKGGHEEDSFFLNEEATDEELLKAFYMSASPNDFSSTFLSGMARILKTSPKKLFRKLSKLLHPDTATTEVEGWEIGALKDAKDWCIEMEIYEADFGRN